MRAGFDLGGKLGVGADSAFADASAPADAIVIPDPELLFLGEFKRAGRDLVLSGEDGRQFTVYDYFATEKPRTLTSPAGEILRGDVVELLAGSPTPGQYAQAAPAPAPAAIGKVQTLTGSATVLRSGVSVQLNVGDAVYKSDVVQTAGDSSLGISFTDGTVLNLAANARMALTEYVYVPNGTSNASLMSIVQGTFTFVAGQVAKTGDMKIATPVATLGIRGTTGGGQDVTLGTVQAQIGATTYQFFLRPDFNPDGTPSSEVGAFDIYSNTGQLIATQTSTGAFTVVSQGIGQPPSVGTQAIGGDQNQVLQSLFQALFQTYTQSLQNPATIPQATKYAGSSTPLDLLRQAFEDALGVPIQIAFNLPFGENGGNQNGASQLLAELIVQVNTPPSISVASVFDTEAVPGSIVNFLIGDRVTIVDPDITDPDFNDQPTPYVPGSAVLQSVSGPASLPEGVNLADLITIDPATGAVTYNTTAFTFLAQGEAVVYVIAFQVRSGPDMVNQTLVLTINGLNEAPTIEVTNPPADVEGNTGSPDPVTIAVASLVSISDSDFNDVALPYAGGLGIESFSGPLPGEALAGLFAIDVNAGTIGYDRADFDFLGAGEQISVVFGFNAQSGPNIVHKTITIFIDGENDPPVSGDDTSVSGTEDDAVIAGSVPPASDIDGDALAFQLVGEAPAGLTFNADGTFSIALLASDQGLDDGETRKFSFDYFANDGTADSAVATVNVTVNGVNDAPLSGGDLLVVGTEDDPIILGAVPAGSDVDGEALTYQLIGGAPAGLTFNPDGTFSVVPLPSDQGMDDGESRQVVFQYIANDGTADSAPATVTVTINGANDAPVALDDSYSITEDMTLVILPLGVLANDSDVDGDTLTAEVFSGPAHGDLIFDLDGSFTYVPDQDFNGEDSFTYVVSDGSAGSNVATVTISVGTENDAPVAAADFYFVAEDDALNIAVGQGVLANDTDADGNPLSAQIVSGPSNGTLVFNTDGSFDYTPFANFNGVDSFVYKANDGGADSSDTVVTINVGSVDDKPSGGGTVALSVEESALDLAADAGDLQPGMVTGSDPTSGAETTSATGGISFTAGEQALSVGFANPSGPNWTAPTILGLAAGYAINWALSAGQLVGTLFQGAVNLGNAIYLALSGQTSASPFAAATPTVTATLTDQLQHAMGADAITISGLPVVATDTSGDNVFATVNLAVGDDEPVANPSENSVFIPDTHSNIVLVIDTSGSMNNPSGVAGLTRLGLVKQSVNTLLDYYDGQGDVSVRIVTFNSAAGTQGDGWLSVAEAKDLVNGLGASGNTNYDAALATAQTAFATDGKIADAQNILYFLSDGDPTIGGGITGAEVQDWQNFLNGNDIYSLAVGLGSGVSAANLHPIAYDGRGEGADTNGTVVANLNQLTSVLVATIPQPIESNILVDGAPDSTFGADGGYVRAIKLGDITYTYDQATNSVTDGAGPLDDATFDAQSHVLTINSAALGTLAIDLDDASYTYTAPSLISGDQAVVYEYTLIDGDGDTDTDTLTISLSIAENSTNAANLAAANFLLHA